MNLCPYKGPCQGCEKRTAEPNCHISCPEYLAYRAKIDAGKAKAMSEVRLNQYNSDNFRRIEKRKHRQYYGTHTSGQ